MPIALPLATHLTATLLALATPDSSRSRIVREFPAVEVHALLADSLSTETIRRFAPAPWKLPVENLQEAAAARAGVVLRGEELHVRGGRATELTYELDRMPFIDPLRGAPLALPLDAIWSPALLTGTLEAEHDGALAGSVALSTLDPPDRATGRVAWRTDGGTFTRYDRLQAQVGAPFGRRDVGFVASLEGTLDDGSLPALRSQGRHSILGIGGFGWRAHNAWLAHVKFGPTVGLNPLAPAFGGLRVEALAGRTLDQPYNRMFTLDGYVKELTDSIGASAGPQFSTTPSPGAVRYRAADHVAMDDTRQRAVLASWRRGATSRSALYANAGWLRVDRLTAVGDRSDPARLTAADRAEFGLADWPTSDPFDVYAGDEPIDRTSRSERLMARAELVRVTHPGDFVRVGLFGHYDHVRLYELDGTAFGHFEDSLRTYDAYAPGGAAWAQGRFEREGMIVNLGLRLNWFSAGPQARAQSLGARGGIRDHWTLAPRLGFAFPVGVRDELSFSYARVDQDPERDFLYDNRNRVSNRQPVGNPALEPATVISYEVAEKHALASAFVTTGFFYRDLSGLVGTVWEEQQGFVERPTYENADPGHVSGVEVTFARLRSSGLSVEASYTYAAALGPTSLAEGVRYGIPLGTRPPAIATRPLDWDRRHSFGIEGAWQNAWGLSASWITVVASGLPWTPSDPRQIDPDLSRLNSRRLPWSENTNLILRYRPRWRGGRATVGLEAKNLFDTRGEDAATLEGYPNPVINTLYDDYGAYRTATGKGGGGYYDDVDGDGQKDWVPVADPRLAQPPRALRLVLEYEF